MVHAAVQHQFSRKKIVVHDSGLVRLYTLCLGHSGTFPLLKLFLPYQLIVYCDGGGGVYELKIHFAKLSPKS